MVSGEHIERCPCCGQIYTVIQTYRRAFLPAEDIIEIVCAFYNVSRETLNIKKRRPILVKCRSLVWHFTDMYTPILSLKDNGDLFGGFDHTTVIHNRTTIQNLIDTEPPLKAERDEINRRIVYKMNACTKS
jgi:chromosomal replication initiator protein